MFDLPQRGADGDRTVEVHHQVDFRVDGIFQNRKLGFYRVDRFHDVGAGLQIYRHEHRRTAVVESVGANIFGGAILHIQDRRHIAETHRSAVAICDDQVAIGPRVAGIVVGVNLIVQLIGFNRALRRVGVRVGYGRAHILQADAVLGKR